MSRSIVYKSNGSQPQMPKTPNTQKCSPHNLHNVSFAIKVLLLQKHTPLISGIYPHIFHTSWVSLWLPKSNIQQIDLQQHRPHAQILHSFPPLHKPLKSHIPIIIQKKKKDPSIPISCTKYHPTQNRTILKTRRKQVTRKISSSSDIQYTPTQKPTLKSWHVPHRVARSSLKSALLMHIFLFQLGVFGDVADVDLQMSRQAWLGDPEHRYCLMDVGRVRLPSGRDALVLFVGVF